MIFQQRINRRTRGHRDIQDLTDDLVHLVAQAGVVTGVAHLFVVGSTAALGTIEFEPGLCSDLPTLLDRLIPPDGDYGHQRAWGDGNSHAHLQATLLGPSLSIPISGGKPALGPWQQVFLLECDTRPRDRVVVATVLGDRT